MSGFLSYPILVTASVVAGGAVGGELLAGETDAMGIDFTYDADPTKQLYISDLTTPANNYNGTAEGKLTYTAPSVKVTRRANGLWLPTNGTTDLPFEWNAAGVLQGLLIEEQRTNLLLRSREFDTTWTTPSGFALATVTADSTVAPDGTTTADTITDANAGDFRGVGQAVTISNGSTYVGSVFVLKDAVARATRFGLIRLTLGTTNTDIAFDTSTGDISSALTADAPVTSGVIDGGTFWRFYVSQTTNGTTGEMKIFPSAGASNFASYSAAATGSVIIWGAQLELGSFPTSPIHTIAATVTRARDQISIATSAIPHTDSVGTLVVAYNFWGPVASTGDKYLLELSPNNITERHSLLLFSGDDNSWFWTVDNGANQSFINSGVSTVINTNFKSAAAYEVNNEALSTNGAAAGTDAACTMPTTTTLYIGHSPSGGGAVTSNVYIRQITYLKRRASNAELQTRTT